MRIAFGGELFDGRMQGAIYDITNTNTENLVRDGTSVGRSGLGAMSYRSKATATFPCAIA